METLQSKADYFECELDPDEFKRDPNAKKSQGFSLRDLPYVFGNLLLTILYFFVTPMTVLETYNSLRKSTKQARRRLRRKYREIRKYGLFGRSLKRKSSYKLNADFITDKMLSSSEDEHSTSASSSGEYQSPDKKLGKGVFTA